MKKWTEEEDALLRIRYPLEGARKLAPIFGRHEVSVRMRAHKLGIRWMPSVVRSEKSCTRCNVQKAASEFRTRQRGLTTYLNATCRECEAAGSRWGSKDAHRASVQRWRAKNPERVKELNKKYAEKSKAQRKQWWAAWYEKNREQVLARMRNYAVSRDKHTFNAQRRAAYARDSSAVKVAYHRRRARLKNAPATLTREEWKIIIERYASCCAYCGKKVERLTQDHVIPLSRGGTHSADNVVPACRSCNASKNSKLVSEWLDRQKV